MKRIFISTLFFAVFSWHCTANATFNSGSTDADGPFNPTGNIEVVLPPDGVLNYTTVDIPTGVTVTFKKNAANTPVYMLATGNVKIAGTIEVLGGNGSSTVAGKGGPGGFDGGFGGANNAPGGKGLGPGGGTQGDPPNGSGGAGGGFGSNGNNGCARSGIGLCSWTVPGGYSYGTTNLLHMIGGSGGGGGAGDSSNFGGSGGGGGGAILIASSTLIEVTGAIKANGGGGAGVNAGDGGGGSGGAVKLVAEIIKGNGTITANGGDGVDRGADGGTGRIRLEASINERTASTSPAYAYGLPASVFPPSMPTLSIASVAGYPVPENPTGAYNQPDIPLPSSTTNPVTVNVSAKYIPVGTVVKVWVIPQYGSTNFGEAALSGTNDSSTATTNVTLSTAYSNIVTAEATFTIIQAMYWQGEEIEKVKVATRLGGGTERVYITRSGKEIPMELLAGVSR